MKKSFMYVAVGLVAIVIVGGGLMYVRNANKEYVDGNVFYYPYISQDSVIKFPMPWMNNSLLQHVAYRTLFLAGTNLLDMTPDLAAKPAEILDNGLVYKITLKSGQKWSDGEEITIDDVLFTINSVPKIHRANHLYKTTFALIDSIVTNGNEITITMKERTTMLRPMLAQLVILPERYLSAYVDETNGEFNDAPYFDKPVTSGMYYPTEVKEGEYMKLERNPYYTGAKPKIETIKMVHPNSSYKQDYYYTNNITEMMNFRAMRGYSEYTVDILFHRYFVYNIEGEDGVQNPAMQDVRVRQAIAMAMDRKALLQNVYMGIGNLVNGAGVIDALGPYDYNPTRAKELLAETEYDLSRPLRLGYYYGDATSLNFIEEAKKYLEAVGFTVETSRILGGTHALYGRKDGDGSDNRQYDILLKGLASFHPSEWYYEYYTGHMFMPGVLGGKGEFDSLVLEIIGETDPKRYNILIDELVYLENKLLYKFPLFTLGQSIYLNTDRLIMPRNVKFGHYLYISDVDFANWEIKTK